MKTLPSRECGALTVDHLDSPTLQSPGLRPMIQGVKTGGGAVDKPISGFSEHRGAAWVRLGQGC